MQQLNMDPHDAGRMDDQEEVYERYQILYMVVFFVLLVKYNAIWGVGLKGQKSFGGMVEKRSLDLI